MKPAQTHAADRYRGIAGAPEQRRGADEVTRYSDAFTVERAEVGAAGLISPVARLPEERDGSRDVSRQTDAVTVCNAESRASLHRALVTAAGEQRERTGGIRLHSRNASLEHVAQRDAAL